jgi:hypothetical protein
LYHEGKRQGWIPQAGGSRRVQTRALALEVATRPAAVVLADAYARSWGDWGRENGFEFRAERVGE